MKTKTKNPYLKYDTRKICNYPFTPDPLGYCWGYAGYVDNGGFQIVARKKVTLIEYCKDCEFKKAR